MSRDEDLGKMLGKFAREQQQGANDLSERARTEPALHELRPFDDRDRGAMVDALFGAEVVPIERKKRTPWIAAAAIAASVAIAGLLLPQRSKELPSYHMIVASGAQETRSSTASAVAEYFYGSRIELVFQPASPVDDAVPVQLSLAKNSEPPRAIVLPVERSEGGAIRVRGFIGRDLAIDAGEYRLFIELGPKERAQRFEYSLRMKNIQQE